MTPDAAGPELARVRGSYAARSIVLSAGPYIA
jgi:hypothetical protein